MVTKHSWIQGSSISAQHLHSPGLQAQEEQLQVSEPQPALLTGLLMEAIMMMVQTETCSCSSCACKPGECKC